MPVKINYWPRFQKMMAALPPEDQEAIEKVIEELRSDKRVNMIRLSHELWRLKVGVWRIFLNFSKGTVDLISVERRSTTTYRKR